MKHTPESLSPTKGLEDFQAVLKKKVILNLAGVINIIAQPL